LAASLGDDAHVGRRPSADRIALSAVAAVAALVAVPTIGARFLYDDTTIIRDNLTLRGWSALAHAWGNPYWPAHGADVSGLYRPLHVTLLATLWNLGGGAPIVFHVYAIGLYVLVAALVWRLLRRAVGGPAAAVAALWFATQPLHVETFASAANTSELLVVAFTVGIAFAILRGSTAEANGDPTWWDALPIALLAGAAMLSKESGLLSLPIGALTAWGWHSRGPGISFRLNDRRWLGSGAVVIACLVLRTAVLGATASRVTTTAPGLDVLTVSGRVEAMMSLWPRIAGMLVWPASLSPYYGPTVLPAHRALLAALGGLMLLALAIGALAAARRGERRLLVALGWMVLSYLPASNLFAATGQLVSDRTLLGATVGVALALGVLVDRLPRRASVTAIALVALLAVRNGAESIHYAKDWTSHRRLWQRLVDSSPLEYRGYQLLGIDARGRGDTTRALALLSRAFAMEPRDRTGRFEYGQILYATGRNAQAAEVLAPLLRDGDVRREASFVAMYLDAVGRSRGATGVIAAGTPLLRGEAAPTAALYVGAAEEQLGRIADADSVYALGLRASPGDAVLLGRRAQLERARGAH